jgi:hypothetical protein
MARLLAWRGRLVDAEAAWRDLLARDTGDATASIGLSQTLRWQGRADAARETLDRVPAERRSGREYAEERRWVEIALGPTAAPAVTYETDSDENHILTVLLRGGRTVRSRVSVGGEAYVRTATYEPVVSGSRTAWGVMGTGRYLFEPGWAVSAGLGVSGANGAASPTEPAWLLSGSTPGRERLGASLTLRHSAFDATALIMEKGVTMTERSLGLRAEPASGWPLEGSASWTTFDGSESNRRLGGYLGGTRTIAPAWQAAALLRSFGFEKDLNDGYFDPDFYFQGELIARWRPWSGRWQVSAEAAPGLEQVRSGTDLHPTLRLLARGAYEPAPGRQVTASVLYTNAGLQAFATGESGYRYLAFTLSGSWAF